ncbi:Biopolymer transport protein ExbD/TolR [Maioricimonas rarisocia]|uniref:Biopolymer transport protein ExbD/TolR n=1 Tax=Maioricimonas rarisocia TaxID=2528026 RepID=A0A517Z8U6_9PLAN|nr:biopolymer transporter ExbD [Maioricimonas rarisocia]QDU38861.1 Biopolymer transport protein ExbD/TolR [Maioricimonas rarisocia]
MPILFRCHQCQQLMSIARRRAGAEVPCPSCGETLVVPDEQSKEALPVSAAPEAPSDCHDRTMSIVPDDDEDEEIEFRLRRPLGDASGLDMTPMVDVTFLLLIFFMITASFSIQKSMQTQPPESKEEGVSQTVTLDDLADTSVIVEIDADDRIRVDDQPVAGFAQLVDVLAGKLVNESKNELLIEPDARCTHGAVVAVMDAGLEVGMQRIRRVTRNAED